MRLDLLLLIVGEHLLAWVKVQLIMGNVVVVLMQLLLLELLLELLLLKVLRGHLEPRMIGWIWTRTVHLWWSAILMW